MQMGRSTGVQAEPNVVPLIDIMMVLLIVFMLFAAAQMEALFAQLPPEARHGDQIEPATRIVLEVGSGGQYAINRDPVPRDSLAARLAAIFTDRADRTLLVRGDGRARYQEIVTALDIARASGVRVVGLWTTPQ